MKKDAKAPADSSPPSDGDAKRASGISRVVQRYDEAGRVPHGIASPEEAAIFALGGGCTAVLEAIDGTATLRLVFARARVPFAEGMTYIATLTELGLIALA
jgi:hypothetical protein